MTRLIALASILALCAGLDRAAAQETELPLVTASTCPLADSVLGRPAHEGLGTLQGEYDTRHDSTFLYAARRPIIERGFVPYTNRVLAGAGPFEVSGLTLGLSLISQARALKDTKDSLPVTLVLDDFTTIKPGNLRVGKLTEMQDGVSVVQVSVPLTRAALLALLRSKSALLKWGHWHVDLEQSDIGLFRAFQRVLLCAPASLPRLESGGVVRNAGTTPRPTTMREAWVVEGPAGTQLLLYHNTERVSCDLADSVLGPRHDEEEGWLGGKYDKRHDSTYVALQTPERGLALKYMYDTSVHFAGRGPHQPDGLTLGFTVMANVSRAAPWSDTMPVTLVLDDSVTLHPGTLHLNQPNDLCCTAPLEVTITLNRDELKALLTARTARFSWADVFIGGGPPEIGMIRALDRALLCAPASLAPKRVGY